MWIEWMLGVRRVPENGLSVQIRIYGIETSKPTQIEVLLPHLEILTLE